jgi:hypothetical protein
LAVTRACFLLIAAAVVLGCQLSNNWITHKDPLGFSVQLPADWKVSADHKTGRIDLAGPQQRLTIWPVFVPGSLDARTAGPVLLKLARSLDGAANWDAPQPAGPSAARLLGRAGDRASLALLTWMNSPKGTAGYVYALSAPRATYRRSEDTFNRILRSFALAGAPVTASGPAMKWVRWNEPRENAWSFEAPAGWQVTGGLFRYASVDIRSAWQVVSPEGDIRVTGGDAEIPYFTEPTPALAMTGFGEGSWYSPGYGVRLMVRRYAPGVVFAREYVARAARDCAGVAITDSRERPDVVAAINQIHSQLAGFVSMRLTAGEASFTCRQNGQPVRGYYFAGTQRTQAAGMQGGVWNAEHLTGWIAREDKAALAQSVLRHILETAQINPQWAAMQQQITANTSRIVSRTSAEISRMMSDSYWSRQKTMDEIDRRRSNAILGVVDVTDPVTGRELKVENSSNYYWIDHRGTIVGTDTYTKPNIDFREMIQLP